MMRKQRKKNMRKRKEKEEEEIESLDRLFGIFKLNLKTKTGSDSPNLGKKFI